MATLTMLEQAPTPKSVNRGAEEFNDLTTETANAASEGLDTKSALEIARIINHEDAKVAAAVKKALPEIAIVIDTVARSLRDGGRLIYVGAGSSGRISALDAAVTLRQSRRALAFSRTAVATPAKVLVDTGVRSISTRALALAQR